MSITKEEAKKLSLAKWEVLRENPELDHGDYMDWIREHHPDLYDALKDLQSHEGLCEYYWALEGGMCVDCPLSEVGQCCNDDGSWYYVWCLSMYSAKRAKAADHIYNTIRDWCIEDETEAGRAQSE